MKDVLFTVIPEGAGEEQAFADVPSDCDGVPDSDNDGWCDIIDPCPDTPGVNCPESDIDHDGIPDDIDDCPNTPGPEENNGCPETPPSDPYCGDGKCNGDETCSDCPQDCCPTPPPTTPPPDPCPCADDPEVQDLLDNIDIQEYFINLEEKFLEEKGKEFDEEYKEALEAKEELKEQIDITKSKWWKDLIGAGFVKGIKDLWKKKDVNTIKSIGDILSSFAIIKLGRGIWAGGKMDYKYIKCSNTDNVIKHHRSLLAWRLSTRDALIRELKVKCPCALE